MIGLRDDAKLRVEVAGSGPTLVLVSGLGGTSGFWGPLVEAMGPDMCTVRFDQRGIGGSDRGTGRVTIRSLAEDTWDIVDALGISNPVLCGHSTGGAIVQHMESMRPGVASGLVLSGTWAGPNRFMERMFKIRLDLLRTVPARYAELSALLGFPPRWLHDNPGVLERAIAESPNASQIAVVRERIEALLDHDCRHRLSAMTVPALVVGAADDMIVPAYLQEDLASLLGHAQLHIFEGGGHFFPITRPEDAARLLLEWISTLRVGHI